MTSTLRSRLMSIVLGPAILFFVTICIVFSYSTLRDVATNEKRLHQTYANQIAAHSYLLYRIQDWEGLQLTAQTSLEHSAIRSITFYDLNGKPIAHAGPIQPPLTPIVSVLDDINLLKNYRRAMVTLPIRPMETINHVQQRAQSEPQELGWVQIQFSFTSLMLQSYQTVFINLFITIALISLLYGIVVAFTNKLTASLRELIKQTKRPDFISASPTPIKELDDIQLAIGDLKKQQIEKLSQAQQQLDTAENDLYTTIEAIEIKNIELDMARREAVRSNKSKSEFLANTSHELRTPLNSIIGFSSLLLRSGASPQQLDHVRAIHDSSQNLLVLINDILDLSRLEANRFVLNNEAFDLSEVVESTLSFTASSAHLKQLELSYSIYSDVPNALIGDANRIRQILTNLLGNAIKFSDRGAVQLRVSLEHLIDDSEAIIHFEVSDEGPGLPNGKQATIFAPFTQFDNSNTRENVGTGLGLSICSKLVQQMNGDLDYESEPGHTRFWFTLRLPIASNAAARELEYDADCKRSASRIVVIDDLSQSRHTSSYLLENYFSSVEQLDNFDDFLARADQLTAERDTVFIAVPTTANTNQLTKLQQWCQHTQRSVLLALPCNIELLPLVSLPHITTINKPVTRQRLHSALLQKAKNISETDKPAAPEPQPKISDALAGVRILLADDIPNNARLFEALLAPHGANIVFAENGERALQQFRRQRFDIAMLDIQMPVMDGLQAAAFMRQWEQEHEQPRIPILAVTAFSDNEQRPAIDAAGIDDILTKPIEEASLISAIQRHLSRDGSKQTLVETEKTKAIFNYSSALQRCSNRAEVVQSMLQQLLSLLPSEHQSLNAAREANDREAMQHIAHKLYGASSYCGTDNLMQTSKQLDKLCRLSDADALQHQAASELMAAIDELLALSKQRSALQQLLANRQ